jgi:hypothetical protein
MPAEAKGTGAKAAKAFARYFVQVINHAMATGDIGPLRAASSRRCHSCTAVEQRVESVYSAGGHFEGDGWHIRSIQMVPDQPARAPILDVGLALSPQTVVKRAAAKAEHFPGGRLPATFWLKRHRGQWLVMEWKRSA